MPLQTLYLRLTEVECNVNVIGDKLQEQLDSREALVVVDSKGMEIHDSPGTQGLHTKSSITSDSVGRRRRSRNFIFDPKCTIQHIGLSDAKLAIYTYIIDTTK